MKKPKSVVLLNPSQKIIELKPGDIIRLANLVAGHYKNHMTVKELIEKLQQCDPDKHVFVSCVFQKDPEGDWRQHQEIKDVSSNNVKDICILSE